MFGKTRQKLAVVSIERAVRDVIKNKTKVMTATRNFGISITTLSRLLMKFLEQENF
jgi:transposase-like protein